MCGIAGKYNLNQEPVSHELISAMCEVMAYRGPDDADVYVDKNIGLGHRRLSILDLSQNGHQPMSTPDKSVWISYNGEIYNYKELQKGLLKKGYSFRSNCDTEVILYLYQEYGERCLDFLRGMFAIAIWDKRKEKLFLARDRIGKKPLYYYFDSKRLLFASEMKAILQDPTVAKEINYQAFYDYFKYLYIPDPKTIYKNIHKLKPGHYLICTKDGIEIKEYWDISFDHPVILNEHEISEKLLQTLSESVRLRMISDVPLGAFLSGGIDSSSVVALMSGVNGKPVTTCSIGFDSQDFDEVQYARRIAERFNTDHHELTVKQNVVEIMEKLAFHFDEPFADSSAVPTYYVSKLARQAVTVALSGDGGDENFAGYEKYTYDHIENRLRRIAPRAIRKNIFPGISALLAKSDRTLLQKGATLLNTLGCDRDYGFYLTNTEMKDDLWQALLLEDIKRKIGEYSPFSVTKYYYDKADTSDHFSKILYVDLKTYLPGDILVKVDRMSMANSLEVRAPMLDHKVIEFSAELPAWLKYNRNDKKYILKQSLKSILPEDILHRRKMGFSVPQADWFRGEIKEFAKERLFAADAGVSNFFRRPALENIWQSHQSGKRDRGAVLWSLLMFELWYRQFMQ
jgi:asparagine synthase (glutamine-hydrolysing)